MSDISTRAASFQNRSAGHDEPARLAALRSYAVLDTPRQGAFDRLVFTAAELFRVPVALLVLIDEDRQWFKAKVGLSIDHTHRNIAFCAETILADEVMVVSDARDDSRFLGNPMVTGSPFIRFYAGAPLIAPGGFRLGSLCVLDTKPRSVSDHQLESLMVLARSAMQRLDEIKPTSPSHRLPGEESGFFGDRLHRNSSAGTARPGTSVP